MRRALVLLAAGCFGKPGFTQRDAPGGDDGDAPPGCTPNQTPGLVSTARRVTWAQLPSAPYIQFADETLGVPMPEQLSISGVNLIPAHATCEFEDQLGVAMFPILQAAPGASGFTGMSLTKLADGPAYASWRVSWLHDLACGGMPNQATGESRFSMFPDGRIIRTDIVTPATARTVAVTDCPRCNASVGDFVVTSYSAFARSAVPFVQRTPVPGEMATPTSADDAVTNSEGGCIVDSNNARLTVLWDQRMPAATNTTRFRVQTTPTGDEVVFVADLLIAPTVMTNQQRSIRTTMAFAPPNSGACVDLIARAHTVQNFPSILVDGTNHGASPDGIYQLGDRAASIVIQPAGSAIPPGSLVEVRMPGTAVQTSRAAADVIWQHQAATGTFHIWFRNGIGTGEAITITSGCAS